jgi:hypothetical protein
VITLKNRLRATAALLAALPCGWVFLLSLAGHPPFIDAGVPILPISGAAMALLIGLAFKFLHPGR